MARKLTSRSSLGTAAASLAAAGLAALCASAHAAEAPDAPTGGGPERSSQTHQPSPFATLTDAEMAALVERWESWDTERRLAFLTELHKRRATGDAQLVSEQLKTRFGTVRVMDGGVVGAVRADMPTHASPVVVPTAAKEEVDAFGTGFERRQEQDADAPPAGDEAFRAERLSTAPREPRPGVEPPRGAGRKGS